MLEEEMCLLQIKEQLNQELLVLSLVHKLCPFGFLRTKTLTLNQPTNIQ